MHLCMVLITAEMKPQKNLTTLRFEQGMFPLPCDHRQLLQMFLVNNGNKTEWSPRFGL